MTPHALIFIWLFEWYQTREQFVGFEGARLSTTKYYLDALRCFYEELRGFFPPLLGLSR